MKQYILIVIENIERFSVGKNIVHACHNSNMAMLYSYMNDIQRYNAWSSYNFKKVVVQIETLEELKKLMNMILTYYKYVPIAMVRDIGKKETEKGTIVGSAIGPLSNEEAEKIGLNKLKLFKDKVLINDEI